MARRTWQHARKTTSEKIKWNLMGVSSERSLIYGYPSHCSKLSSFLDNSGAKSVFVTLVSNMFEIYLSPLTPRDEERK